jgi:alpha-tubulin suppressor-like RCC1 family protein
MIGKHLLVISLIVLTGVGRVFASGTVTSWGIQTLPYVSASTRFTKIAAGVTHNVALTSTGEFFGWGDNGYLETKLPMGVSNVVAIAAGGGYTVVAKADGTVVAWGASGNGVTSVPNGLSNVVAISSGRDHSLALKKRWDSCWVGIQRLR